MKMMQTTGFLKAFRSVSLSLAILLASVSMFIYSIKSVKAADFPESFEAKELAGKLAPNSTATIGKYMMVYQMLYDTDDKLFNHFVIIWDTETGKSKVYKRNGETWVPSAAQLPANPLQ